MKEDPRKSNKLSSGLYVLSVLFLSFYILGTFFPNYWWTTHWLAFLSPGLKYASLLLISVCILYPIIGKGGINFPRKLETISNHYGIWIMGALTLLMGILIYHFPIVHDYYGDSYKLLQHIDQRIEEIPPLTKEALFRFGLSPWDGHSSVLALVTYIAYYGGISYGQAFLWLDLVCGCLYVFIWLAFVRYYLSDVGKRLLMGMTGISAPFMLIYFGHMESYAPVFLFFLSWMLLALWYIESQKKLLLWSLIPLLLLCLKLHPVALLFIPALGLLFLHRFAQGTAVAERLKNWRGIAVWILAPIYAAGAVLYFFVFEDYNDPRSLNETAMEFDRLFLPLLSPDPPLERYNLLSFNHIFDYFSEMLLWSPGALFIGLVILIYFRKAIDWNALSVQIIGISLLLFGSLFFVINPLLSMQLDWDLLAIPGPVFLTFILVLIRNGELPSLANKVFATCLGLSLLSVPMVAVHSEPNLHSQRLERVGIRIYKTYYEWSNNVIQYALDIPKYPSREAYEKRKENVLEVLKPYAIKEHDFEYARLLVSEAKYHLRVAKNYPRAMSYLQKAIYHFPKERNAILYMMETSFIQKKYEDAFKYSMQLVEIQYPSEKKSIAIAVQCALEAQNYEEALSLSSFYLQKWQDNKAIEKTYGGLKAGENVDSLKYNFRRE